ncbi:type II toxin-antitoxin system PemK/MazF family toxin [Paeniglutamicibacter sp. ABSL32-1]|uniref:type II toxin-antitoxin system PemK/MazF family toxin n=1 Tax=Paeniglutamicibacter quisquiliarum TaxID=2849498 RepID=UPI001C2DEED7|nr:type II toxin-antitoxin system PemK/MazF family toxin [Paeniglutamicibacter quisquiliarum]MBV1778463.1 type II toxin-antitoxin system PemK/MazF family toxin [Paeniglutamicibacter quisquiliarum]
MKFNTASVLRFLGRALSSALRSAASKQRGTGRPAGRRPAATDRRRPSAPTAPETAAGAGSWEFGGYPGDFRGTVDAAYSPRADGRPDPGEIVWAWVPYEEDHAQGKDRPVLLVGQEGQYLLALMLTSKDRNNGQSRDRDYVDIGTGSWDRQGRPSEVKLDRIIRLQEAGIRREGAVLGQQAFARVAERLAAS